MAEITLEHVHEDLVALRHDIVRLEAKIDSKPSVTTMWMGIFFVVFGMLGIIASTVTTLNALGFIKVHA